MKKNRVFPVRIQMLHLFVDDTDTYVAFDADDAENCFSEFIGETRKECTGDPDLEPYEKVKDFSLVKFLFEDECKTYPLFSKVDLSEEPGRRFCVTAPAWAWALYNGRGFLCSTEY